MELWLFFFWLVSKGPPPNESKLKVDGEQQGKEKGKGMGVESGGRSIE